MTRFLLSCLLVCCLPLFSFAQVIDNFSDGDFNQNPAWQGDGANFIVNPAGELQLNATIAGSSSLTVQGNIPDSVIWNLRFRLGFAPSVNNLLRIYLLADQSDLASTNGYFLEIGENGSLDALRLFRQDATGTKSLLATGQSALVATNPDIRLRISRSKTGDWAVEAAAGNDALQPQFTVTDATHAGGSNRFFGFQCVYTVSNTAKFYFDDISILPDAPDTQPPVLLSANADNAMQVTAVFDENLDSISAVTATNYIVSSGVGEPTSVALNSDQRSVRLSLPNALASGSYTLQVAGVKDVSGNTSAAQSTDFQFIKIDAAAEFDILINEIMADPTPAVAGLPEVEWLELLNRSNKTIDLSTLRIQDATGSPVPLPTYLIPPGGLVALTALANATTLQAATSGVALGAAIGTTALNNDGDALTITDLNGNIIDHVMYDVDWHTDPNKTDGGWSLERINPNQPCVGSSNWQSCPNSTGGTLAAQNASLQNTLDNTPPRLLAAFPESPTSLLLTFSEGLDKSAAQNTAAYRLMPPRAIALAEQLPNSRVQVRLTLSEALQVSTFYALTVKADLTDCSGNAALETDTILIGLTENPEQHDVIINEIMAAPTPSVGLPEVEWLELLNRSSKIIDLAQLQIQDATGAPVALPPFILLPGAYIALTAQANATALQTATTGKALGISLSASALNNDGDVLTISDLNGNIIDRVTYALDWHTEIGKGDGGWSLERINPDLPCLGGENWRSCPALPGGTPGVQNASLQNTTDNTAPRLRWAYPESATSLLLTFSEDLDKAAAQNTAFYLLTPNRVIASAEQFIGLSKVRLTLAEPLQAATLYAITVEPDLTDCSGNAVSATDTAYIGLPEKPEPQDIVLNEVMLNPATGNARYIEFYNRSQKVFDWSDFFIANFLGGTDIEAIVSKRISIPGQYDVFTTHPNNIRNHFDNIVADNLLENDLPSLTDKEENITLYWSKNGETVVLDSFDYSEDYHNALFTVSDRDGVALERIDISGFTNAAANWTSASSIKTGAPGTPTLPNSQRLPTSSAGGSDWIYVPLERLSPDDDGFEDFLDVRYTLPRTGFAATMTIFDSEGIPVRRFVRQELIGTEGALRWDGDLDDGSRAKPGIYVLFAELYAPSGETERIKKAVAVVSRF